MENVQLPQLSAFVGHGYVQHRGSELRGGHRVWYKTYLNPGTQDLPSAIAVAYGDSTRIGSSADELHVKKLGCSGKVDVDIAESENERSAENDKKYFKLTDFILKTGGIPEND